MKNSYFSILWQNNKLLFILVLGFILGQIFFSYKSVETVPFFNYGMYSSDCNTQELYTIISLYQDEKRIPLNQFNRSPIFLEYQLRNYARLIEQDSFDYVKKTIYSRFKKGSVLANYLITYLTNPPKSIEKSPPWIKKWTGKKNISIKKDYYKWVNCYYKLVKSKTLH
jgi:hypothetical protein